MATLSHRLFALRLVVLGLVLTTQPCAGRRMDMKVKMLGAQASSASQLQADASEGAATPGTAKNEGQSGSSLVPDISPADTSFMIVASALVQFMTPGLALFYGGLVRDHNVLTVITQNFLSLGVTSFLWIIFLYSLCFGSSWDPWGFIGNPFDMFLFRDVGIHRPLEVGSSQGTVAHIPGLLYALYENMFAVITPALMTGAFADRLRFLPWLIFLVLWEIVVYAPWCHMIWGGGFLAQQGVADFAGGIVVHTTAGFSCLAIVMKLGRRRQLPDFDHADLETPHSVPMVFLGAAMLWFGWFGFNGGSSLAANGVAVVASWNSQIAAAAAMLVWAAIDWVFTGKPGLVGKCVGAIAGLATVTPAAGFIQPSAALILGAVAAPVCYVCVVLSKFVGFDDALDVWAVHGMGGFVGSILLGLLADGPQCADARTAPDWCVNPGTVTRSVGQFALQVQAAVLCAVYCFVVSYVLITLIGLVMPLSYTTEESHAADEVEHGEKAYATASAKETKSAGSPIVED